MSALTSSRPAPAPRPSYAAVLRVPHSRRTFAAALTARLSYGTVGLAVMLAVTRATGSYAVSGTVMAAFGAAAVFLMPSRAALVDRHGPRRALIPMASLYGAMLCVLTVLTWRPGAPPVLLGTVAALTGACAPPLGPTMRTVWAGLLDDPRLVQRAYSLDGVAEELLFVSGPVLVGVLVRFAPPAAGVALSALLIVAGTCAFVASPAMPGPRTAEPKDRPGRRFDRGLLSPVVVAAGMGLALSGTELLVMALATERSYDDAVVPWILAALSAGSAVGGLLNGVVDWHRPARVRLACFAAGLGLVLAVTGLGPGAWALTAAVATAGLFMAPALTTAYLLAEETASPGAGTQAGAWVNTAVNAGSSGGSLLAGMLVDRVPVGVCFALAGGVALGAGAICLSAPGAAEKGAAGDT